MGTFVTFYTAAMVCTLSGGIYELAKLGRWDVMFAFFGLCLTLAVFLFNASQQAGDAQFFKSLLIKRVVTATTTIATFSTTMALAFGVLNHNCHVFLVLMFIWPAILILMGGTCILKKIDKWTICTSLGSAACLIGSGIFASKAVGNWNHTMHLGLFSVSIICSLVLGLGGIAFFVWFLKKSVFPSIRWDASGAVVLTVATLVFAGCSGHWYHGHPKAMWGGIYGAIACSAFAIFLFFRSLENHTLWGYWDNTKKNENFGYALAAASIAISLTFVAVTWAHWKSATTPNHAGGICTAVLFAIVAITVGVMKKYKCFCYA